MGTGEYIRVGKRVIVASRRDKLEGKKEMMRRGRDWEEVAPFNWESYRESQTG